MNNSDSHISMEDINSVALGVTDLIENKLEKLDAVDESALYDLVLDLMEKFYQYPDYRHWN